MSAFHRHLVRMAVACLMLAPASRALGQIVDVPLTVTEPNGVARTQEAVTCGVPIPLSAASSAFALFDGATELPVQATVLAGKAVPWVLLDFRATVGAGASKTYQLRSVSPTATPSQTVVLRSGSQYDTVLTGRIRVIIRKNTFNLFDQVSYDTNNNGVFVNSERIVNSTNTDNLVAHAGLLNGPGQGTAYVGRGTPTAYVWEESGPLRRVLRVEGNYRSGSTVVLGFTTRFTFHAGQNHVTVEHVIRNSQPLEERYVKLASAQLRLGSATTITKLRRSGDQRWVNPSNGNSQIQLIPDTLMIRNGAGALVPVATAANGGMLMGDMSRHGGTVRFDFEPGLSGATQTARATAFANRLVARAPEEWYSDRGAFGSERFGTYTQEKATYTSWGWTWPSANSRTQEHHDYRPTFAYQPGWATLHPSNDPESDDLWQHLLMWSRTGLRTYLDRADAWARYEKWEHVERTDGFLYAWDGYWEGPVQPPLYVARPLNYMPAGTANASDTTYRRFTILPRKDAVSHMWNGGLVDYYYLTGDRDALLAAKDMAEKSDRMMAWRVVGQPNHSPSANIRAEARQYFTFLRVWEATDSTRWRNMADKARDVLLGSAYYDSRGFWGKPTAEMGNDFSGVPYGTRFPNGKYLSPWMNGIAAASIYRHYVLTGDPALRTRLLAMAGFAMAFATDSASGFTGDDLVVDSPNPGNALHLTNGEFRGLANPTPYSYASSSNAFIDVLAIAWRLDGDWRRMALAKHLWDRSSKGPENARFATATQVGHFVNSQEGFWNTANPDRLLYVEGGDLTFVQTFFREAATTDYVPPATASLGAGRGRTSAVVSWNAPGDDGSTGQAMQYDLRYSTSAITDANFGLAVVIPTGAPQSPGMPECVELQGLPSCTDYYFALKTLDDAGNWSLLSNVPSVQTNCNPGPEVSCGGLLVHDPNDDAARPALPASIEFAIAGSHPAGSPVAVRWGVPADQAGHAFEVALFDVTGRRVRTLARGVATPGRAESNWDLRDEGGARVSGGVYFARFVIGRDVRARKVVLVR